MRYYHGSKEIVTNPIANGSNIFNDYGPSFYATTDLLAAKSWASKNDSTGYVNVYDVSLSKYKRLNILDLTDKSEFSVLNWIAILMHFRSLDASFKRTNELTLKWLEKFYIDVSKYDLIIGFRADDAYFRFPIRFITNDLAYEDLEKIFMSGNLGTQYAFMSEKAIKSLKFLGTIKPEEIFVGHHFNVVKEATQEFNELLEQQHDPRKTYILDLMRKDYE